MQTQLHGVMSYEFRMCRANIIVIQIYNASQHVFITHNATRLETYHVNNPEKEQVFAAVVVPLVSMEHHVFTTQQIKDQRC